MHGVSFFLHSFSIFKFQNFKIQQIRFPMNAPSVLRWILLSFSQFNPKLVPRIPLLLSLLFIFPGFGSATAQQENEKEAQDKFHIANKAQLEEDYRFAVLKWEEFLQDFPHSPLIGKASYQLGLCYERLGRHADAAHAFGLAIPKLGESDGEFLPLAYFYQAFSQFQVGQSLSKNNDEASAREANIQLTTAAKNFEDLLAKFPNAEFADQARFFQGNAYEGLRRTEDAINSYTRMLEYEKPHFKKEGLYFLGQLFHEQGKLKEAVAYYERFAAEENSAEHPLFEEVEFNQAKALVSFAAQHAEQGDANEAVASYRKAEEIFKRLAKPQDASSLAKPTSIAHEALFQQAYCLANLNQAQQAAEIYEQVALQPDSPHRMQALLNAGRCYLDARQPQKAVEVFKRASEIPSPAAAEGAALLVRLYLDQENYSEAFQIADAWIAKQPTSTVTPFLMIDRAEAALKLPARKSEAPALFLQVFEQFPEHSTAPSALYSAAYAQLQLHQAEAAVALVDRFVTAYPKHELLVDTREIKADALLLADEAKAESEYDQLLQDFPNHEKQTRWFLRSAVAKFFQKKYQETIELLQSRVEELDDPRQAAEAYHWLGASHFFLDQAAPSVAHLEKSIGTGERWRSSDETLLTLARAYLKEGNVPQAQQTIEQLKSEFKDTLLLDRAYYFLGEYAYQTNDFTKAFESFQSVYRDYPLSDLVPNAIYNAAWSKMKLNQGDESNALFTKLISEFPNHELAEQARAGRGAAARKTGDMKGSIADLKAFIETKANGEEKFGAMFELALVLIESKSWTEAAQTLQTLLKEDNQSPRRDAYHYELAWVFHELDQVPESLEHFAAITKLQPVSQYSAESYFHLASEAYRVEDFEQAAASYQQAIDLASDNVLKEKSLYKLGWTFYKRNQFAAAFEQFDQLASRFPDSKFAADGQFMGAESLFQQKKYHEAWRAYTKAQPLVEASETIDPKLVSLTHLHGAQAANFADEFQSAIDLATPLTAQTDVGAGFQADAWLEIGTARQGLNQALEAVQAWEKAKNGSDKTAIRARCLIGDHYFKEKQFDRAINEFKEIQYRYGDEAAAPEIKAWVAYAHYEGARCYLLQASEAAEEAKVELIKEAIRQFEGLLNKYPEDRLAPEARSQLEKLRQIRR
jgi:cellulose synthase operon protein C